MPSAPHDAAPLATQREVNLSIPENLKRIYELYPEDTEFYDNNKWIFLSENEIRSRALPNNTLDVAVAYAGLGHVDVLCVHPNLQVFVQLDGGANGHDRQANHQARLSQNLNTVETMPFETWCGKELGGAA